VYCVSQVPVAPFNTFISGDGDDKCYVWSIVPSDGSYKCVKKGELPGHTETLEYIKFNHDGKLVLTGGMNNVLRVWSYDDQMNFTIKCKLENGPAETDDILFVDWHPKGNALICGGKDYMIWLMNGATGDFLASFSGHEDEVLKAQFSPNGGKLIVSSSADKTIRVWSPIKQNCVSVIRSKNEKQNFHQSAINVFALHHTEPMVVSGDLDGKVCYANY
jgi:WD40 repeat protein